MDKLLKGEFYFKIPLYHLKKYIVNGQLTLENRQSFVSEVIKEELQANHSGTKKLGWLAKLHSCEVLKIKAHQIDREYLEILANIEAIYVNYAQNQIIEAKVTDVSNKGLELKPLRDSGKDDLKIEVPVSHLSVTEKIVFNRSAKNFVLNDSTKIKEGDVLRLKIINFSRVVNEEARAPKKLILKIKASCRNNGLGKI